MITAHPNYEAINSFVTQTLALLKTKQQQYYNQNGKTGYFQGLMIPSQTQLNGSDMGAIDFGLHPDDQADSWTSFYPELFNADTRVPVNISCQVYSTPDGDHGWIFKAEFWREGLAPDLYGNSGNHWIFQHNAGPDTRQGVWDDWFCMVDDEL